MILLDILKNRLGLPVKPKFCTFLVTWRCNARCKMCTVWQREKVQDLTLEEIKNIFKQQKFDAVRISGGEPFLREDIGQIIDIIQKYSKPKVLHITTNGLLSEKIIDTIKNVKRCDNLHIKISIDAFGDKHDQIRGIDGAFAKATETLKKLSDLRKEKKFYLGVNQTIVDNGGIDDYYKLKDFCKNIGVQLHVVIAYSDSALYLSGTNINLMPKNPCEYKFFYKFNQVEIEKMLKLLAKEASEIKDLKEKIIKKYYIKGFYNRVFKNRSQPNPSCLALKSHLRINPNGDVPICLFNSAVVGNLKKQTIKEIWNSNNAKMARNLVKKCPGCWVDCEVIPTAIYSGDLLREIINFRVLSGDIF